MTDSPTPLTDAERLQQQVRSRIADLTQIAHEHMCDDLFDSLDKLHKQGINDDDVIRALRHNGETDLADEYIEWSGALDPDREDPSTLSDVVPDPAGSPSYAGLAEQLAAAKAAASPALSTPALDRFIQQSPTVITKPSTVVWP